MRHAALFTRSRDPKTLTVCEVMEDAVVTVGPETKAAAIAHVLAEQQVGSVPVVADDRTLVGLISEFDLLWLMDEGKDLNALAAEAIMTRNVVSVTEGMALQEAIQLMRRHHLMHVPVVDGAHLVGILARRDILFGYVRATASYLP